MMRQTLLFLAASLASIFIFSRVVWRLRMTRTADCFLITRRLRPGYARGVEDVLSLPAERLSYARVKEGTRGLRGLWDRQRNAPLLLQLCQLRAESDQCFSEEELRYVLGLASKLRMATLRASFSVCFLTKNQAKADMQLALRLYIDLAFQTHAFYADDSAPLCGELLAAVL